MFHNTTPDVQDQDHSMQDQDRFFWSQTSLVLRPMVSDHITRVEGTCSIGTVVWCVLQAVVELIVMWCDGDVTAMWCDVTVDAAIWKVIRSWLSAEQTNKTILVNRQEMSKYVTADQLEPHMVDAPVMWYWDHDTIY